MRSKLLHQKSIIVTVRSGEGVVWTIRKARGGKDYLELTFTPRRAAALRNLLDRSLRELVALLTPEGDRDA